MGGLATGLTKWKYTIYGFAWDGETKMKIVFEQTGGGDCI